MSFVFFFFFALRRRWKTQLGAEREGKTTHGKTAAADRRAAHDRAAAAATAEFDQRDRRSRGHGRRHRSHAGRVVGERDAEQCAGRRATPADAAQAQVLDGELVHSGRADRSREPDILSGGQLGRLRGECVPDDNDDSYRSRDHTCVTKIVRNTYACVHLFSSNHECTFFKSDEACPE